MMNIGLRGSTLVLLAVTAMAGIAVDGGGLRQAGAQGLADRQHSFDIPAKPIRQAINDIVRATGINVVFPETPAASAIGRSVRGSMSTSQAIATLLAGSGLQYSFTNANTVTITAPSQAANAGATGGDATMLAPIVVTAQAAGTNGYVAETSTTGTKTDTAILEVPQTINVVTRKEMDDRGVTDFNSAVAYTPGVRMIDYPGGQGMPDIYLRGFRAIGQFANYRDGLRNGFNSYDSDIEMYAFDRLDVLKGPSSILYGQATPGGLVNATTKRPTEDSLREVQVQYGSFARKQAAVDLGGPVNDDGIFLYRLTGLYRDSGTQIDHSPDDSLYIAPAFTWKPDDATSLTLLANYQKTTKGGAEQSLPMDNTIFDKGVRIPSSTYLGVPGLTEWKVQNTSIGTEFRHEFDNGWTYSQNARYSHSKVDYTAGFIWDWPTALVDGHFANIGTQKRPKATDSFLFDNNISGEVETGPVTHTITLGADYGYYSGKEKRSNSSNFITIDIFDPVYDGSGLTYDPLWVDEKVTTSQFGVYAQDQLKFDNWILSLGGRYDWVKGKVYDYLSKSEMKTDDAAFSGRIGLGYTFDNGVVPYVSYSTSFQPDSSIDFSGNPFKPTTGQQYEVGVKYQPIGWNALFTASVFQITQQNVSTADPVHIGYAVQQGEVRSRGFELEAKASLTDELSLTAGYSYTDARITEDNPNTSGVSAVGSRSPSVPYHTGSLWLYYDIQDATLDGLKLGAGLRYVGSSMAVMDTSTGSQVKVPGHTLLDASISYDFGAKNPDLKGLTLALSGTNLTDEKYFTPGFYSDTVLYGNRRTINATLSYKW
ncbi:TonB-dependent siderophore receptor [Rhizobium daejeonense]|uniref:TonB-dependent siderophore receptor n=1 Tax=Rhizobium daejeonense TaxID=240521 RepID=A0A6M1RWP2_9HYPH|nr:TonB-dependent siderophore receptor [Rhizobium daejeonense]NGO65942.1 TonB-dependent siderophore receptor [Rhizobium daejeonense]